MTVAQTNYPPVDATAPDVDAVVTCPGCTRLTIQIANQPIYLTFGRGPAGAVIWEQSPEPYLPVVGSVLRDFDAFKYRAKIPAAQLPAGAVQAHVFLTPRQ